MIKIENLNLSFPHKVCFEHFSATVTGGERIAIMGRNGSGKSSLLEMIAEENANIGYVPQIIEDFNSLSGGEKFNKILSQALAMNPGALLLDEPTNHLDSANRKGLLRMLQSYGGILIIATHDREILRHYVDTIWHIDGGKINIFHGKYDDYVTEIGINRAAIERQIEALNGQKKSTHEHLMKERERIAKSKASGQKKVAHRKWIKAVGNMKANGAEKSQGSKLKAIDSKKQELAEQLENLKLPEIIVPKFSISAEDMGHKMLISIRRASVGYLKKIVLSDINLSVMSGERVAIVGNNGSGKTTLVRGILNDPNVIKSGEWDVIAADQIGYLDQFYGTLDLEKTAFQLIPDRKCLNEFLFRKNEEVNNRVKNMSGGEKARLSLALISAKTPKLLILDEITNNIDLETKDHVVQVLKAYPGALLIISHDSDFLNEIGIDKYCGNGELNSRN
ncbi:MAG: ATP-binding cassette domain-containing protein [Puniceicoccales bacterium]|jgi:ATPase subunit of ABC transporter with duplicated ATPase domains|nr:ATP-binding cassette domain-containing protein [Puniceicoccales bacterium]